MRQGGLYIVSKRLLAEILGAVASLVHYIDASCPARG
jgi:hypothetical protein